MRSLLLSSLLRKPATVAGPGGSAAALDELGRTLAGRAGKLFG